MNVFGLKDGKRKTLPEVSEETGMSLSAVKNYIYIALEKLKGTKALETRLLKQINDREQLSEEEQTIIKELKDIVFAGNMMFVTDEKFQDEKAIINSELFAEKIEALEKLRIEKIKKKHQEMSPILNTKIEDLELSTRAYNCLFNAGITTLGKLGALQEAEILKIENLGLTCIKEIRSKLAEYELPQNPEFWEYYEELKQEEQEQEEVVEDIDVYKLPLKKVDLSTRLYNALSRAGFTTLEGVRYLSDEDLMKIRSLGEKSLAELKAKLHEIEGNRDNNTDEEHMNFEPEQKEADEKQSDDIDELSRKKAELEKVLLGLKQKAKEAENLLDGYNSLVDTDKINANETQDFKD